MKSLLLAFAAFFLPASLFAAAPTLGNATATVLTGTTARIAGTVSGGGVDVTVTVNYGPTTTYGSTQDVVLTAAGADAPYTITLSGLTLGTVYHFKVVASNATDPAVETADATFVMPPELKDVAAVDLPGGKARITGTVTGGDLTTTLTVSYGKTTAYGSTKGITTNGVGVDVPFEILLSGLEFGATYHFKVAGKNASGPATESADGTFIVPPAAPPTLKDIAAVAGEGAATITGTVSANGAATTVHLEYGDTSEYGTNLTKPGTLASTAVDSPFSFALPALKYATTYHFKVVADNGIPTAADSGDQEFTVPARIPGMTTPTVNVLSPTEATITAAIVTAKGSDTEVWVDYGTAENALNTRVNAAALVPAAGSARVELKLTGLVKGTLYYYRVTAKNGVPTETTASGSFSIPQKPDVSATVATTINSATVTALVTAHGDPVTLTLDYGKTASYGTQVVVNSISDSAVKLEQLLLLVGLPRNAEYNYRLTASNSAGSTLTANATFKTSANNLPVANEDIVQAKGRSAITIDVLANDTDKDGDKLTILRVSQPTRGTTEISGTKVLYTPGDKFAGTDAFTYVVSDGQTGVATGRVTIRALQVAIDGANSAIIKNENGDAAGAYKIIGTAGGKFTARVSIGGENSVVTGQLDADGKFSTTLANGTSVSFSVKENGASNSIVADFERPDGKYTAETTVNAVTDRRLAELVGHYNITLPAPGTATTAGQTSNGLPQGAGFMTMDVKTWGGVSVRGVLGDGSKFSYGSTVSGTDAAAGVPIWLSPKDARVSGTVGLAGTTDITATGTMNWYRPADDGAKRFADGFYTSVNATGAAYTPPAKKERVLNASTNAATITLQGGDLAANITRNIQIDTESRVQLPKGVVSKLTIYPRQGTFAGTFEHPYDGDQRTFQGVLLPNQNVATGVFTGRTQTGTVKITPGATAVVTPPVQQPGTGGGGGGAGGGAGGGTGNPGINLGTGGLNFGN